MTYFSCEEAPCTAQDTSIKLRIAPRKKDLGEFSVRRVLPAATQRMVGPFVFFDHMRPATFPPGKGIDVRPHPHIGIATITYLFQGEILHRDSLGVVQSIHPGAINLMTAGRGIVHSERPGSDMHRESRLHGIQSWMGLPAAQQEIDPDFSHHPAHSLPKWQEGGVTLRLIMGELSGQRSPVPTYSRTLYADLNFAPGAAMSLPMGEKEQALDVAEGDLEVAGEAVSAGEMAVLDGDDPLHLHSPGGVRVMLVGGDPLGKRHMFWNFVSDDPQRIEQAKEDWRQQRFPEVPGDPERIPLPGED